MRMKVFIRLWVQRGQPSVHAHRVRFLDRSSRHLGDADVIKLALVRQSHHGLHLAFDANFGIDAGALEEIEFLLPVQAGEYGIYAAADVLRAAIRCETLGFHTTLKTHYCQTRF